MARQVRVLEEGWGVAGEEGQGKGNQER